MDNGSLVQTDSKQTFIMAGREGGSGTITMNNGSSISLHDTNTGGNALDAGAGILLGRDISGAALGSRGSMTVTDSTVNVTSDNNFAFLTIGRDNGSIADLTVTGASSSVTVESVNASAGFNVSDQAGSQGSLTITDGATVNLRAATGARFEMGRGANTNSTALISNGGVLNVTGDTKDTGEFRGGVRVGAAFDAFGRPETGPAHMTIEGADSAVNTNGAFIIGAPIDLYGTGGGASDARVTLRDGGTIRAEEGVHVGQGGVLDGDDGNIIGNLFLDGGTIAPGASPGELNIDGHMSVTGGGVLELEFAGSGDNQFDVLNITGDFLVDATTTIVLSFLDGFATSTGDSIDFLNVGGNIDLAGLNALNLIVEGVSGADFSFVDEGAGVFSLFTEQGGVPISAVPVPAALPLLLTGIAGLALFGRRRKVSIQNC